MFKLSKLVKKVSQRKKGEIKGLREQAEISSDVLGPYYYVKEDLTYKGDYDKGLRHGFGIQISADGEFMMGEFKNDMMNGTGIVIQKEGEYFIGSLVDGKKQGKGEQHWRDGSVYQGPFENDTMHGNGMIKWGETFTYIGSFEHGYTHNVGIHRDLAEIEWSEVRQWKSESQWYYGEFKNEQFDGLGQLRW